MMIFLAVLNVVTLLVVILGLREMTRLCEKTHSSLHEIKNSTPPEPKYRAHVETTNCSRCGKHVAVFDPVSRICAHCLRNK